MKKYLDSTVPSGTLDNEIQIKIERAFQTVGSKIEAGQFKNALDEIFELVHFGNKYFDSNQPWKTRTTNPEACADTLFNCVQLIANLSVLLAPFLPFSSYKIFKWFGISDGWNAVYIKENHVIPCISILFERIYKCNIPDEVNNL